MTGAANLPANRGRSVDGPPGVAAALPRAADYAARPARALSPTTQRFNALVQFVLFGLFVSAGGLLFALPVLLPVTRDYARLVDEERGLSDEVSRLQARIKSLDDLAQSMRTDPKLNERMARSDLGFAREGEEVVMLRPTPRVVAVSDSFTPPIVQRVSILPYHWPGWSHELEVWADDRGLVEPFLDSSLRTTWLLMAGGLVVSAFVLFAPRIRHW